MQFNQSALMNQLEEWPQSLPLLPTPSTVAAPCSILMVLSIPYLLMQAKTNENTKPLKRSLLSLVKMVSNNVASVTQLVIKWDFNSCLAVVYTKIPMPDNAYDYKTEQDPHTTIIEYTQFWQHLSVWFAGAKSGASICCLY